MPPTLRIPLVAFLLLSVITPAAAEAPILSVPPAIPATTEADRADPAAWQAAMPSLAIGAAFLAEKEERGPEGEHIPRADNEFANGQEVYFYVSLDNVARMPATGPEGAYAIALRAQVRAADGAPLTEWIEVHTYAGTMTMAPEDPEYFNNWVTGGLAFDLPPGQYQLALEFTDTLRAEPGMAAPVEVILDLLYPDQQG